MSARRRARARRDRDGGYLLVEALVTLALSALVIGGLLALSGLLMRSADRAAARAEGVEADRRAVDAMVGEIRTLARLRWSGKRAGFVFLGAPDRLVFARLPIQANGLKAPVAVAYQASGPGVLLRAEGEIPVGAAGLDDVALSPPRRLDAGSGGLRFGYVRRLPVGSEIVEEWTDPDALPLAVLVERRDPATGDVIETSRAAILAQAEPGCAAPDKAPCSLVKRKRGERPGETGEGGESDRADGRQDAAGEPQ